MVIVTFISLTEEYKLKVCDLHTTNCVVSDRIIVLFISGKQIHFYTCCLTYSLYKNIILLTAKSVRKLFYSCKISIDHFLNHAQSKLRVLQVATISDHNIL